MQALIAFFESLFAGIKARLAAQAGSELKRGEAEIAATDKDVQSIEGELRRSPASASSTEQGVK